MDDVLQFFGQSEHIASVVMLIMSVVSFMAFWQWNAFDERMNEHASEKARTPSEKLSRN